MEQIILLTDDELKKKYEVNIRGIIISCVKHIRRYGSQTLPKEVWLKILFYAMKGIDCKESHLDIAQRDAIYRYLIEKDIKDPYVQQFLKESKEPLKSCLYTEE